MLYAEGTVYSITTKVMYIGLQLKWKNLLE